MPWSVIHTAPAIIDEVQKYNPQKVIELGIGFGKYGALVREILDGIHGRCAREQWQATIRGVEIFEPYANPLWQMYDQVTIGNFLDLEIVGYDLVLMVDSLEHLAPTIGRAFIEKLKAANKRLIVSVPNGPCPQDGVMYGNEHERHLATYYPRDIEAMGGKIIHTGFCVVGSIPGA